MAPLNEGGIVAKPKKLYSLLRLMLVDFGGFSPNFWVFYGFVRMIRMLLRSNYKKPSWGLDLLESDLLMFQFFLITP